MEIIELTDDSAYYHDHVAEGVFDHEIETSNLEAFLGCPGHLMVLAIDGQEVIGMASAVKYFHPDKSAQLWINEIGVTPKRHNLGIGRQLVQALLDIGRQRGCICAWLGTDQDNTAAQRCFDAVTGGENPQRFLLYQWKLALENSR